MKPDVAFGYGRRYGYAHYCRSTIRFFVCRVCPGKALAEASFNIIVATVLHVANISMLEDEPLSNIVENRDFVPGVIA